MAHITPFRNRRFQMSVASPSEAANKWAVFQTHSSSAVGDEICINYSRSGSWGVTDSYVATVNFWLITVQSDVDSIYNTSPDFAD